MTAATHSPAPAPVAEAPAPPRATGAGTHWCDWCRTQPGYRIGASRWVCSDACNRLLTSTAVGAGRLGIPVREYRRHVKAGEKWCWDCQRWQKTGEFGARHTKPGGLDNICKRAAVKRVIANARRRAERKGLAS